MDWTKARQHLLSIAVFRGARERQPGTSDPGVGPRIEIFRNLRLACRMPERLHGTPAAINARATSSLAFDRSMISSPRP